MARKKEIPPKPAGRSRCKGEPFIAADGTPAMTRCDCPSGYWFRARDNERLVRQRLQIELGVA